MVSKKVITAFLLGMATVVGCYYAFINKNEEETNKLLVEKNKIEKKSELSRNTTATSIKDNKKHDLYSTTPYEIPLVSIYEISKLPENIKTIVDKDLEASQGFYYLKKLEDKIFVILQNPVSYNNTYSRHDLQFIEIFDDGKVIYHNAGYIGADDEIAASLNIKKKEKDSWILDETTEPYRPLKHVLYDEKGKVKFTEYWNYDENEPIKYKMLDSKKNLVSVLKETQDNDSNLRKEHVFYDSEGNTTMSLTVNYDGANISRLMFYNSHDLVDSVNIMTEYVEGLKIKESVYDEKYQLKNIFVSAYEDGVRKVIRVFDSDGNEIDKISS